MSHAEALDLTPQLPELPLGPCIKSVTKSLGKTPMAQVKELARLRFGRGKISPQEYFYYRLYDDAVDAQEKKRFVGKALETKLHQLTCEPASWVMAHDKLVCYSLLQSLGFPIPQTAAVYRRAAAFPGVESLGSNEALASYLRRGMTTPLFGKPVRGIRSGGVLRLEGYDAASDTVIAGGGQTVAVDALIEAIGAFADEGYLFQHCVTQHPDMVSVCGATVATARIIVLVTSEGPMIHRALWKIPSGSNIADNFWREGNCLALLDKDEGQVTRVIQGSGPSQKEIETHPTSRAILNGFRLPDWDKLRDLVLSASSAFPALRMQAWDIAFAADGPLIVELNVGGDYNLPQLATARGMLDDRFVAFIRDCAHWQGRDRAFLKLGLEPKQ